MIDQRAPAPHDGEPPIRLHAVVGGEAVGRFDGQRQQLALGILDDAVADVAPNRRQAAAVVLVRVEAPGALAGHVGGQELLRLEGREEARLRPRRLQRQVGGGVQRGEVDELHAPVVVHAEPDGETALIEYDQHNFLRESFI